MTDRRLSLDARAVLIALVWVLALVGVALLARSCFEPRIAHADQPANVVTSQADETVWVGVPFEYCAEKAPDPPPCEWSATTICFSELSNCKRIQPVEIGLRPDGLVVWRFPKEESR